METVKYLHAVNSGDLISSLSGMKNVYATTGKKAQIFQRIGMRGEYYAGAKHPLKNDEGEQVTMTLAQWNRLTPLLESQEYIESCHVWEGQEVDINLNKSREGDFTTMPFGMIQKYNWYCFPALACDLSKKWLDVPSGTYEHLKEKVIVNRTERYTNELITYYFLKKYEDRLIFSGMPHERELFCKQFKLDIPYLEVDNFYQLAQALNSCKFTLCNQSMVFNICEGLKSPRLLETFRPASNCIPIGENAYDFLHQGALEFYFQRMMGEVPELAKTI